MAGEDPAYIRLVKQRPCPLASTGRCVGPIEAHHPTYLRDTGHDGRRAHDHNAIGICHGHHVVELHGLCGFFRHHDRERLREWQEEQVTLTRLALLPLIEDTLPGDAL